MPKLLLRVREVAETLSVCRSKAYDLVGKGEIPSVWVDGALRVPASSLEAYVAGLQVTCKDHNEPVTDQ